MVFQSLDFQEIQTGMFGGIESDPSLVKLMHKINSFKTLSPGIRVVKCIACDTSVELVKIKCKKSVKRRTLQRKQF